MTRKDYKLIACALKRAKHDLIDDAKNNIESGAYAFAIYKICACLSISLKRDNDRFDRTKFYAAIHNDKA